MTSPNAAAPAALAALRALKPAEWSGQRSPDPAWLTDGMLLARRSATVDAKWVDRLAGMPSRMPTASQKALAELVAPGPPQAEHVARLAAVETRPAATFAVFVVEMTGRELFVNALVLRLLDRLLGGWDYVSNGGDALPLFFWRGAEMIGATLATLGRPAPQVEPQSRAGDPPRPRPSAGAAPAVEFPSHAAPGRAGSDRYMIACLDAAAEAMGGVRMEWRWVVPTVRGLADLSVWPEAAAWRLVVDFDESTEPKVERRFGDVALLPGLLREVVLPLALPTAERRPPHPANFHPPRRTDVYGVAWRGAWCVVGPPAAGPAGPLRGVPDDPANPARGSAPRDVALGRASRLNTAARLRRFPP